MFTAFHSWPARIRHDNAYDCSNFRVKTCDIWNLASFVKPSFSFSKTTYNWEVQPFETSRVSRKRNYRRLHCAILQGLKKENKRCLSRWPGFAVRRSIWRPEGVGDMQRNRLNRTLRLLDIVNRKLVTGLLQSWVERYLLCQAKLKTRLQRSGPQNLSPEKVKLYCQYLFLWLCFSDN